MEIKQIALTGTELIFGLGEDSKVYEWKPYTTPASWELYGNAN